MANRAEDWIMGRVICSNCGYEWKAAVDDFPKNGRPVAEIVTGRKEFRVECPKCGQPSCGMEVEGV